MNLRQVIFGAMRISITCLLSVQTWSHDAGDMVEHVYVRGRLMDGPAIRLGILQTAESEGESD